jgi:O-antigen ligase
MLLKLLLLVILVLPSYMVIPALGASGSVGQMLAFAAFNLWLLTSIFGLHNPIPYGHPGRAAVLFWALVSCASYSSMVAGFSGASNFAGRAAADRWLLLILAGAGITFLTTESVRTVDDIKAVTRWILGGGVFCCVVALLQFEFHINPTEWIASIMVGFRDNGSGVAFQGRDPFMRVSGTTMHPIELSVVCSMLLPLSVWWAIFDTKVRRWLRFGVPALLFVGNVITVSRTGMIGLGIVAIVLIPYLPRLVRRWAVVVVPTAMAGLFLMVPGMVSTLFSSATAGSNDSSITYRTDDYPLAWRLFFERPLLGMGPGSWMPDNTKNIFDNQYLLTIATMGGIGVVALLVFFLGPFFAGLTVANRARTAETRVLGGAVAAAMLVACVSAGTFDAMSFQTFVLVCHFFIGLCGVSWLMVKQQLDIPLDAQYSAAMDAMGGGSSWIR